MRTINYRLSFLVLLFALIHSVTFALPSIEIFTMPGCERCSYSLEYMKEHNINYVEYSIADVNNNSKLMELLKSSDNYEGGSITMPVIKDQGYINFNINDLDKFLAGMNGNQNLNNVSDNKFSNDISDDQKQEFLDVHNSFRSEVNSDPLSWSDELAAYAKAWGEQLAQTGCELNHRPGDGEWAQKYGENLYWSSGFTPTPKQAVESWGNEKPQYDGGVMNDNNFAAGHYTQMIWAKTTKVGCAIVPCSGGAYIVVCNYNPAGNMFGESPLKNIGEMKQTDPGEESKSESMAETIPLITSTLTSSDTGADQISEFLSAHNTYRSEVNSDPLIWSEELGAYAKAWGEQLAKTGCELNHRPGDGEWAQKYGENLYWSSGFAPTPKQAVDSWGSEKPQYDGGVMNDNNFAAGHYTQMIWSKTTKVGCAIVQCSDGAYIVVCNYDPAGNMFGESPLKNTGEMNQTDPGEKSKSE